jgi:predicted nucleotidyltransferase
MTLREAIQVMTNEIVAILGENKPSIYLYGSAAFDDFKLGWSDIDILVLTKRKICAGPAETLVGLRQSLLERYPENPYFRSFEGDMRSVRAFRYIDELFKKAEKANRIQKLIADIGGVK